MSRNIEVAITTLESRYGLVEVLGFLIYEIPKGPYYAYRGQNMNDAGIRLEVTMSGEWQVKKGKAIVQSGYLDDDGVEINTGLGATNTLTFYTLTPTTPYRFLVNGVIVPVDFSDILPTTYDRYNPHRQYYFMSMANVFMNACMENAW